jgi:hypothetical protein
MADQHHQTWRQRTLGFFPIVGAVLLSRFT